MNLNPNLHTLAEKEGVLYIFKQRETTHTRKQPKRYVTPTNPHFHVHLQAQLVHKQHQCDNNQP